MNIYWTIVEVNFTEAISSESSDMLDIIGFFQTFGCTARSEEDMKKRISEELQKNEWLEVHGANYDFDISIIQHDDVESEILMDNDINESIISSPFNEGIWYQSGKAFFHNNNVNDDIYHVEVAPKNAH